MSFIQTIKEKFAAHREGGCCCGHGESHTETAPKTITQDMIVREVADRWPQTASVEVVDQPFPRRERLHLTLLLDHISL